MFEDMSPVHQFIVLWTAVTWVPLCFVIVALSRHRAEVEVETKAPERPPHQ